MNSSFSLQHFQEQNSQIEARIEQIIQRLGSIERIAVARKTEQPPAQAQVIEECPVKIHRVTEGDDPKMSGQCPVTRNKPAVEEETPPEVTTFEEDDYDPNPNMQEYKKIRRVMGMITQFYSNGTKLKRANYEEITVQIENLDLDLSMVEAQLASLRSDPVFKRHPKLKEYETSLTKELEGLLKAKGELTAKQKELFDLSEWSKTIVKVCQWLELNLEEHCAKTLNLKISPKPVPILSEEEKKIYSRGLGEITYNLRESQDFFQASLDGRLNKYHNIEKNIILSQLEALKKFPEDNPRRQYVEGELLKDLEYVNSSMEVTPQSIARREKMLKNHNEFFKVLTFHKDKLKALGVDDSGEKQYDPKYDHYQD